MRNRARNKLVVRKLAGISCRSKGFTAVDTVCKPSSLGYHRESLINDQVVFVEYAETGSDGEGWSYIPIPWCEESGLLGPLYLLSKSQSINNRQGAGLHPYKNKPFQWEIPAWCYGIMKTKTGHSNTSLFLTLHLRELCSPSPALLLT